MTRAKLAVAAVVLAAVGLDSCSTAATSDSGSPNGVRVQHYEGSGRSCLVFTHDDTQGMGGVSIAVDCVPIAQPQSFGPHE